MGKGTLRIGTYLGSYYLVRLIAIGGMAEIYLATTKGVGGFEKQLALKVIHPDFADDERFVQMLVDEAKIAVKLNHPNIAQTFDLGRIDACYFISMEYVDGSDFFQLLKKVSEMGQEFPVPAALLACHETLCGLEYAHKKCDDDGTPLRIIHRDISPQNILLSRHGEVKIVDFGIAKAANLSTKTRAGVIKGKLVYMSPEQSWGDSADQRSDIFSAGIVLYEALTGGSLYREKNPVRLLEMVRRADIPPPSTRRPGTIGPELDDLVMRALRPRPEERYQTAGEFADRIAHYLSAYHGQYTTGHLGELVEAVAAGRMPPAHPAGDSLRAPTADDSYTMRRDEFASLQHSIIFSAADMQPSDDDVLPVPGAAPKPRPRRATVMAPPRAKLVLKEEGGAMPYPLGDNFIIGRAGDLRLGDARVSRRHARVRTDDGGYVLEDLSSSNGTFVNEQKLDGPYLLQAGDTVRIGPFYMVFEYEDLNAPVPPPEEAASEPVLDALLLNESASLDGARDVPVAVAGPAAAADPAPAPAMHPDGARMVLNLGGERLCLPVGRHLPLSHSLLVEEIAAQGCSAAVVLREDGYWIEPVVGRTQVSLNGQPLAVPVQLGPGDRVAVGPVELVFEI